MELLQRKLSKNKRQDLMFKIFHSKRNKSKFSKIKRILPTFRIVIHSLKQVSPTINPCPISEIPIQIQDTEYFTTSCIMPFEALPSGQCSVYARAPAEHAFIRNRIGVAKQTTSRSHTHNQQPQKNCKMNLGWKKIFKEY